MGAAGRMPEPREMEMIDEYLEHLRRSSPTGSAEQTCRDRRAILERLNHDLEYGLGQVTTAELAAWLHRPGLSQNSKATYYRCLRSFYAWASDPADAWITANPAEPLTRVRTAESVSRACTDEQAAAVLTRAAEPYRTWAKLAAYQALRCCEISRLDREHVTEASIIVHGKGGRLRVHDTDPDVWAAVKDLPRGPIAVRDGVRITPHRVSIDARGYFHRTLRVPISMHQLRHWAGATIQREYKDVRVTQRVLGHAQLSSTMIYTAATDAQQRSARQTLPRFS